jgi:hypothetical protein
MCAIGSSTNNSLAAISPQATGLGPTAIGGSLLTGARRVAGGRPAGSLLTGAPGGGGTGGSRPQPPTTPRTPNVVEY